MAVPRGNEELPGLCTQAAQQGHQHSAGTLLTLLCHMCTSWCTCILSLPAGTSDYMMPMRSVLVDRGAIFSIHIAELNV